MPVAAAAAAAVELEMLPARQDWAAEQGRNDPCRRIPSAHSATKAVAVAAAAAAAVKWAARRNHCCSRSTAAVET